MYGKCGYASMSAGDRWRRVVALESRICIEIMRMEKEGKKQSSARAGIGIVNEIE